MESEKVRRTRQIRPWLGAFLCLRQEQTSFSSPVSSQTLRWTSLSIDLPRRTKMITWRLPKQWNCALSCVLETSFLKLSLSSPEWRIYAEFTPQETQSFTINSFPDQSHLTKSFIKFFSQMRSCSTQRTSRRAQILSPRRLIRWSRSKRLSLGYRLRIASTQALELDQ